MRWSILFHRWLRVRYGGWIICSCEGCWDKDRLRLSRDILCNIWSIKMTVVSGLSGIKSCMRTSNVEIRYSHNKKSTMWEAIMVLLRVELHWDQAISIQLWNLLKIRDMCLSITSWGMFIGVKAWYLLKYTWCHLNHPILSGIQECWWEFDRLRLWVEDELNDRLF